MGDIDGDRRSDVAVAFHESGAGRTRGRLDILSGATGAALRTIYTPAVETFGGWIEIDVLGNIDGREGPEVAVGLALSGFLPGRVFIISVADGRVLQDWTGDNDMDRFGQVVAATRDLDGDGFADVLATSDAGDDPDEGFLAWLGFPELGDVRALSSRSGEVIWKTDENVTTNQAWGTSLATCGDVNGDGVPDVVVGQTPGAYYYSAPNPPGCVWLLSGSDGARLHRIAGAVAADNFGNAAIDLGDIDADGMPDILVSSDGSCPSSDHSTAGSVRCVAADGRRTHYGFAGAKQFDAFGHVLEKLADWDGDCVPDWLVTAPQSELRAGGAGYVQVHSGRTGQLLAFASGESPGDEFGWAAAAAGDVDADGHEDIAVTARCAGADRRPVIYFLSGRRLRERWITGHAESRVGLSAAVQR